MDCSEWIDFSQKNKPQSNALSGGLMVMLIGGLQMGWIFVGDFSKLSWTIGESNRMIIMTFLSFYATMIFGLYVASVLSNRLTKNSVYFTAATFACIGSAFLIIQSSNLILILIGRMMIGFSHGFSYVTIIVHGSEIVIQKLRGTIISTVNFCIISSILTTGAFTMTFQIETDDSFGWSRIIGITGIIYATMGLIFVPIFSRESPVSLIRQKHYDSAVTLMCQVRQEMSETWQIKNEFNELKVMVEEDEQTSKNIFSDGNSRPLMLIALLKVAFVVSLNYGLNMVRMKYTTAFIDKEGFNCAVIVFMGIRMTTALVALFTIDAKGRKLHFLLSHAGAATILILFGIILMAVKNPLEFGWLLIVLQCAFEALSGIGLGSMSDVYSSEAFSTAKKAKSIGFTSIIEMSLHIIIIVLTFNHKTTSVTYDWIYLLVSGILLLAVTIVLNKELPQTANMSIRQSRNEFLKSGEIVFSGSKMPQQNITFG